MRFGSVFLIFCASVTCTNAREVNVTVLATTDLHGHIFPYDYLSGRPAERGLAKIATLIKHERKNSTAALLVDCGDTIQGSQLESVYQQYVASGKFPAGVHAKTEDFPSDPMMLAMNHLGYDAMAVGNHEYNYGLKNLDKARSDAKFPWLSANTKTERGSGRKPFDGYVVKQVDGAKIAIIGITTPAVPIWEKPENYKGYSFENARTATEAAIRELRAKEKPDVMLVISHSGVTRQPSTETTPGSGENIARDLAMIDGVDAILFGHTHDQVASMSIGNTLLAQPKNWGISLARMDLKLESRPGGGFRIVSKQSRVIPVTKDVEPDPEILRMATPYHALTERYLNTVVGAADQSISAKTSRVEDSAIIDAIHQAQLYFAKADVSFASSFNPRASIEKGPITVRQIAALYLYDNELYAVEGTGKMVKDALENAARYFHSCADASCSNSPLINPSVIGYNFDMAQGVTYDIDLLRPVGDRIQNLQFQGKPLGPDAKLRLALNNYRAAGSNGYGMFKEAKIVWRSYEDIRDLMLRYYSEHALPTRPDDNWRVSPEPARRALIQEAGRQAPVLK